MCWPCVFHTPTFTQVTVCDNVQRSEVLNGISRRRRRRSRKNLILWRGEQMCENCVSRESNREKYGIEKVALFHMNHFKAMVPLLIQIHEPHTAFVYNVCWLLSCTNIKRHKTVKKPFHLNFRRPIQSIPHKLYQHVCYLHQCNANHRLCVYVCECVCVVPYS